MSRLADRAAREHRVADITDLFELADRVLLQPFAQRREDPLATDAIPRPTLDTQPLGVGMARKSLLKRSRWLMLSGVSDETARDRMVRRSFR